MKIEEGKGKLEKCYTNMGGDLGGLWDGPPKI